MKVFTKFSVLFEIIVILNSCNLERYGQHEGANTFLNIVRRRERRKEKKIAIPTQARPFILQ